MKFSLENSLFISLYIFAVISFIFRVAANVFLGVSVLIFLIIAYKNKGVYFNDDKVPYFKAIGIFAGALFVSALFSGHVGVGLKVWADFFLWRFMPFMIVLFIFDNKSKVEKILYASLCGFLIDCLFAIYQGVFVYKLNLAHGRAAGFVGHPMTLAGWACILVPVLLIFIFRRDIAGRFYVGLVSLFAVGSIALVFNSTRGAWLALAIVLPLISIPFILKNKKAFMIFTSIILAIGVTMAGSTSFMARISSISDTKSNWSNTSRFIIWDTSYAIFKEHPMFGCGLGQFKWEFKNRFAVSKEMQNEANEYHKYVKNKKANKLSKEQKNISREKLKQLANTNRKVWEYKELRKLDHAHNNFMQMLAENGLVGLFGYVCAFGYILWRSIKNYFTNKNPYALMIVGSTSALLLQGLTEYNFGTGAVMKLYWLVLACLIVLASHYNKEESSKDAE